MHAESPAVACHHFAQATVADDTQRLVEQFVTTVGLAVPCAVFDGVERRRNIPEHGEHQSEGQFRRRCDRPEEFDVVLQGKHRNAPPGGVFEIDVVGSRRRCGNQLQVGSMVEEFRIDPVIQRRYESVDPLYPLHHGFSRREVHRQVAALFKNPARDRKMTDFHAAHDVGARHRDPSMVRLKLDLPRFIQ